MANTGKKRTASGKSSKPTVRRKKKAASLEDIESSIEKMALTDFAESTKEELRKLGDKIHIKGHTTDLELDVESMQIDNVPVEEGKAGDSVGVKVPERVRKGDVVYKIVD